MTEKRFQKGIVFENDTYYKADKPRYDIYPEDCVRTSNELYFPYTPKMVRDMPVGFFLRDLQNVTLDFQNATLVFHGRITPFILDSCKNVRIINFKVDYDRPFYTQAHVLERGLKRMKIRIDDGFDYRVDGGYLYVRGENWEKNLNRDNCMLWLYDRTGNKEYDITLSLFGPENFPTDNPPMPIGQILVEEDGEDLILHGEFPEDWDANNGNNSLIFTHEIRDKCSVIMANSKDIVIENFILVHGAAYAILGMNVENLHIDNFSMYMDYQGNGRLVANNADGVHLFNCKGEFVLKNSYMEGLMDDTVNVHNNYLEVVETRGDTLVCSFTGAPLSLCCPIFAEGDRFAVFFGKTLDRKGEYTITEVSLDEENERYLFKLDREPEGIAAGDIIENLSGHPTVLIENCEFGRFRGTMRLQSREKTVVRNCSFNNKEWAIIFTGDTTYWFESGPVNDFLIEGCSFPYTAHRPRLLFCGEVEFTETEKYYHKNITIRNCRFDPGLVAAFRRNDNVVFENNSADGEMFITARKCGRIRCDVDVRPG